MKKNLKIEIVHEYEKFIKDCKETCDAVYNGENSDSYSLYCEQQFKALEEAYGEDLHAVLNLPAEEWEELAAMPYTWGEVDNTPCSLELDEDAPTFED